MITPAQSRAARGLLNWTQKDLQGATGLSLPTINGFERGTSELQALNAELIRRAFIDAGVEFPDNYGVRLRTEGVRMIKGDDAMKTLWNFIFERMQQDGGEILITHVDEKRTLKYEPDALLEHIERLKKHGITERLLSCEGDDTYLMPKKCYRWLSKELFTLAISSYVFLDFVALQTWAESKIILIQDAEIADAERRRFEALWKGAKTPA